MKKHMTRKNEDREQAKEVDAREEEEGCSTRRRRSGGRR
jgi:hypothetical protein